jgi:hypothetical protein
MKTLPTIGVALLLLTAANSCKNADHKEESTDNASAAESVVTESAPTANGPGLATTSAASTKNDNGRQFLRTADMKFKVDDVAKSTYAIENTVQKFGGIVTNTNLQSVISEHKEIQVSPDSTLETTKYTVENSMTLRVPNRQLDTVVKAIAKQVNYLDFRIIKAEDASLQMLSNNMAQARNEAHKKRMENAIDKQSRKLNDIASTENGLLNKQENADNAAIENLSTRDKVAFSTVTLALYEKEKVKQELVANEKSINAYRPHIGLQIWDSLKTGWFILEGILAFVAKLWSLILIALIAIFLFRKYGRKTAKPAL